MTLNSKKSVKEDIPNITMKSDRFVKLNRNKNW